MSNIPKQIFPIFNYNDFNTLDNLTEVQTALNNDPNFGSDVYASINGITSSVNSNTTAINSNTTAINNLNSHYKYSGTNGYINFDVSGNFTINNSSGQELILSNGTLNLTNSDSLNQTQLQITDLASQNVIYFVPNVGLGGYNNISNPGNSLISGSKDLTLTVGGTTYTTGIVINQSNLLIGSGTNNTSNLPSNYYYFNTNGIGLNTQSPNYNLDINGSLHSTNFIRNHITNIIYNGGSGTSLSLNYTSVNPDIIFFNPTSDFSLIISNLPTTLYQSYNFKLYLNAKYYCNSININGTAVPIIAVNGFSNISINASSTYILQEIQICFFSSTTPIVITNICSLF